MMKVIKYPDKRDWKQLIQRPTQNFEAVKTVAQNILNDVKQQGDIALKKYTQQFDGVLLNNLKVSAEEFKTAESIDENLKQAIKTAIKNVRTFHSAQQQKVEKIETMPGIVCWRKNVAIEKVGLYIPGGTAPLFSTLIMLGIPAMIAGCKEIVVCTPPQKNGLIHSAILFAAQEIGITTVYKIGGAQAIAALAYGTETINRVYKIFGPGNQYITCAKILVNAEGVAIDMPAGPSEVAVLADESANAEFIAADLSSQAEHGKDSQVLLVTNSEEIINQTIKNTEQQLKDLPRKEIALAALQNSKVILVNDINEGIGLINEYAPEHLIIACDNAESLAENIINAGSVFIGNYSPESVGDYASGTNHTLPTNGFAKAYSGVSLDTFYKNITFQQLSKQGLENIAATVTTMAQAEGLQAHANAVMVRLNSSQPFLKSAKMNVNSAEFNLENILRNNVKKLVPYSSARSEFEGDAQIFLDANENSLGSSLNNNFHRYPDPLQKQLKAKLSAIKNMPAENIFVGNGSDEVIDLIIRAFCEPAKDEILIFPPTYGMYEVAAAVNDVAINKVLLSEDFQLNIEAAKNSIGINTKIIWICSPNNPTGNLLAVKNIEWLLKNFNGIIVVDEAYIDFADADSWIKRLNAFPNLVVLQTLSKAWGLAGLRIGFAYASKEIINVLNKIKPPYNISEATQQLALQALQNEEQAKEKICILIQQRERLQQAFKQFDFVKTIYPSDANFILIKVDDANDLYNYLLSKAIVVRNRSNQPLCENCLRVTVGTPEENEKCLSALKEYK